MTEAVPLLEAPTKRLAWLGSMGLLQYLEVTPIAVVVLQSGVIDNVYDGYQNS